MPTVKEIVQNVKLLLDGRISLDQFGDWMLVYTGNIVWPKSAGGEPDEKTKQLAYVIQAYMTNFDTKQIDEDTLRKELANAIRPHNS